MKKKIFIIILMLSPYLTEAQDIEKALFVKQYFYKSINIEDSIFFTIPHKKNTAYLRLIAEDSEAYTNLHSRSKFPVTGFPFCWDVFDSLTYVIDTGDNLKPTSFFFRLPIEKDNLETVFKNENNIRDNLRNTFETEEEYKNYFYNVYLLTKAHFSNQRPVFQINHLVRNLTGKDGSFSIEKGSVCFDMIVLDSANIEFYIRDIKQLTRWHYNYPPTYLDQEDSDAWEEIITYSSDTIGSYPYLEENLWIMHLEDGWQKHPNADIIFKKWKQVEEPYCDNPHLPSGRKHKYEAISDSVFFQGHFKAIKQSEQRYLVNTMHGAIYILTPEEIIKIGQLKLNDYPLLNKEKVFIEDRDNNQLIFFAPVTWLRDDVPLPNIKVITDKTEFDAMFGNIDD